MYVGLLCVCVYVCVCVCVCVCRCLCSISSSCFGLTGDEERLEVAAAEEVPLSSSANDTMIVELDRRDRSDLRMTLVRDISHHFNGTPLLITGLEGSRLAGGKLQVLAMSLIMLI